MPWLLLGDGPLDDVIKRVGQRLGSMEIESALVKPRPWPKPPWCGRPDDLQREGIVAFSVTLADRLSGD